MYSQYGVGFSAPGVIFRVTPESTSILVCLTGQVFGGLVCVPALAEEDESCIGITVATNTYTEGGLMLLNFNDVPSSLVTLLVLFVVNDW